jgi:hypothetical protein
MTSGNATLQSRVWYLPVGGDTTPLFTKDIKRPDRVVLIGWALVGVAIILGSIAWAETETVDTASLSLETLNIADPACISDFATTTSLYNEISGKDKNLDWTIQKVGIAPLDSSKLVSGADIFNFMSVEPCTSTFLSKTTTMQCKYRSNVTCDDSVNLGQTISFRMEFEVNIKISSDALNDIELARDDVSSKYFPTAADMSNAARNGTGIIWGLGMTAEHSFSSGASGIHPLAIYPNGTIKTPDLTTDLAIAYTYWPDWVSDAGSAKEFMNDPTLFVTYSVNAHTIHGILPPQCEAYPIAQNFVTFPKAYYTLPSATRQQMSSTAQAKYTVPCVRSQQVQDGPGFSGGLAVFLTVIGLITFFERLVYRSIQVEESDEDDEDDDNANTSNTTTKSENESDGMNMNDESKTASTSGPVHTGADPVLEMSPSQIELDPADTAGSGMHQRTSSQADSQV